MIFDKMPRLDVVNGVNGIFLSAFSIDAFSDYVPYSCLQCNYTFIHRNQSLESESSSASKPVTDCDPQSTQQ